MNFIEEKEFIFAINDEVWTDLYKSANRDSCHSTRTGKYFKPPHLEVEHPGREDLEREVPNLKWLRKLGRVKVLPSPTKKKIGC